MNCAVSSGVSSFNCASAPAESLESPMRSFPGLTSLELGPLPMFLSGITALYFVRTSQGRHDD